AAKTALQITTGANLGPTTITLVAGNSSLFAGTVTTTLLLNVMPALTINGDGNANTIRLIRNGSKLDLFLDNVTAVPTAEYEYGDYGVINVAGLNSNDSLILDYTAGDPIAPGG